MAAADPVPASAVATRSAVVAQRRAHPGWALAGWLLMCHLTGGVGGLALAGNLTHWYAHLAKPVLTPPDWVFLPVWLTLYTAMALAAWLVWRTRNSSCRRRGLRLFLVQLVLNLSWTYLFFAAHSPGLALLESGLLALAIALTAQAFFRMTLAAGWLMVAYLAWVLFAGYLNWGVWRLNG